MSNSDPNIFGPKNWYHSYSRWGVIGQRAFEQWPESEPLPDEDIAKLKEDGIQFVDRIAKGGYGDVWRTVLSKFKEDANGNYIELVLACKIIRLVSITGTIRDAVSEITKELDISKRLNHAHIIKLEHVVRIYDERSGFPHPIRVLCFMELCSGSLKNLIKWAGKLPESLALDWFVQIANALQYLHQTGVAHLDIKPENILVKTKPNNYKEIFVMLTDFGLSETFTPGGSTITDVTAGTTNYKAPELLSSNLFDAYKTDIYSLGITLCESLAGCDTRTPPVMIRIVEAIQRRTPFSAITPGLQHLIRGMTLTDPQNRFSIDQVLAHPWTEQIPYIPGRYFSLV